MNRVHACLRLPLLLNALVLWVVMATTLFGQGVPMKDARAKFSKEDIKEVFRGDPTLPDQLAGHIFVLGSFTNMQLVQELSNPNESPSYKRRLGGASEKLQDECKKFAREFASATKRYQDKGVIFLGVCGIGPAYTKPAVLAHAQELKFTAPIVQVQMHDPAAMPKGWGFSQASVNIFDHLGLQCYEGKLNDKADDAIRKALRDMAKPKP